MTYGIIAAESQEMLAIKEIMTDIKEETYFNLNFIIGKINNTPCILVECGVGKVNAARTTQIIIDKYSVDKVINVGSAGSLNPELNIGDIVIGNKLVQYDFDVTSLGYEKGDICDTGKFFESDPKLVKRCEEILTNEHEFNHKIGIIGSADLFNTDIEFGKRVREEFGAECVEMEGAAIAQVCFLDKIPFIVIRGISDSPNGNNKMDFRTYLKLASKQAAYIVNKLI